MEDNEKRDKIIKALQMALDAKREGTLQELVTWLKAITPLKIKNAIVAQQQTFTDRKRANSDTQVTEVDDEDTFITELQSTL